MTNARANAFWGLFLLLLGGLFLALNLGWLPLLSTNVWAVIFAVTGLLFLVGYVVSGIRNWGLLFPALGALAIAATIWMAEADVPGETIGGMFMLAVALPFWAAFLVGPRENWWAIIPGWIVGAIGVLVLLSNTITGDLFASLIMFAIGLPFLVVYLANRKNWWALIPGGIMTAFGLILLLGNLLQGDWFAVLLMLAIAAPFYAVYVHDRRNWWALIPAGVMTSVALMILVAGVELQREVEVRLVLGTLFAGLAATFAALWLLRAQHPTDWAKYPAVGLALVALIAIVTGPQMEFIWPLILVGIGLWLLIQALRPGARGV
jgi:hypothetical protein